MTEWLKGCEICNAGLCAEMDKFIKIGSSTRGAAKELVNQQVESIGTELYSAENIRKRYEYYKISKRVGENLPHNKPEKLDIQSLYEKGATVEELSSLMDFPIKGIEKNGDQLVVVTGGKPGCETTREVVKPSEIEKAKTEWKQQISTRKRKIAEKPIDEKAEKFCRNVSDKIFEIFQDKKSTHYGKVSADVFNRTWQVKCLIDKHFEELQKAQPKLEAKPGMVLKN